MKAMSNPKNTTCTTEKCDFLRNCFVKIVCNKMLRDCTIHINELIFVLKEK